MNEWEEWDIFIVLPGVVLRRNFKLPHGGYIDYEESLSLRLSKAYDTFSIIPYNVTEEAFA